MKGLLFIALMGCSLSLWGFVADRDKVWQPDQILRIHLVDATEDEARLIKELTKVWFESSSLRPKFILGWPKKRKNLIFVFN